MMTSLRVQQRNPFLVFRKNCYRVVAKLFFAMTIVLLSFLQSQAAISFDGLNDYVNLGTPTSLNLNNNFTISAWIKASSSYNTAGGIVSWGEQVTGKRRSLIIWNGGSGTSHKVYFSGFSANISGTTDVSDDTWHHAVVTLSSSNEAKVYVDGVLENTGSPSLLSYSYQGVNIGRTQYPEYHNGLIDDVRIYNKALSETEIETLYKSRSKRIGGSLANGLIAHFEMDDKPILHAAGQAHDSSGNNNHGAFTNFANLVSNGFSTDVPAYIGSETSLKFDGVNDYVSTSPVINPTTSTFSITTWFKTSNDYSSESGIIWSDYGSVTNNTIQLAIGTDNNLRFIIRDGGGDFALIVGNGVIINDGQWHSATAVRTSTTTVELYIDGIFVGTNGNVLVGSIDLSGAYNPYIGRLTQFNTNEFKGLIDDLRIYNDALTAAEVAFLYNGSGSDPGPVNLVGHWDLDDSAVKDASGNANHGAGVGGASLIYNGGILKR